MSESQREDLSSEALEQVLGRVAASAISKDAEAAALLNDVSVIDHERRDGMAWFSKAKNARHWTEEKNARHWTEERIPFYGEDQRESNH
jgi:hypothetical protein